MKVDYLTTEVKKLAEENASTQKLLLRLTEEVVGLRKDFSEFKKNYIQNNSIEHIVPGNPFANIQEFMEFEESIKSNEEKFKQLVINVNNFLCFCSNNILIGKRIFSLRRSGTRKESNL